MPGPPPKPADERARRNRTAATMTLPSKGRKGRAPKWPLVPPGISVDGVRMVDDAAEHRELQVWADLWKTPQATAWEQLGWTHNVALYVRCLVAAEFGNQKVLPEVRQWTDRLGLSPMAMLRLQWVIAEDEVAEKRSSKQAAAEPTGARARYAGLSVVGGSDAAGGA